MNRILRKETLAEGVVLLEISAPRIAGKRRAGQFVIIRLDEKGERIPLTLVDSNPEAGSITLVVQVAGATTLRLAEKEEGDTVLDLIGPLGHPTPVEKIGTVAVIAGGVGAAEALPVIRAWKSAENQVITIVGARTRNLLILLDELRDASDELHICTDDGSFATAGLVTWLLNRLINNGRIPNLVYAIGPVPMMRAVSQQTRPYGIKTMVSLNPLMVDGTGMCGCCRVSIDGETKFACVEGPDFDAHQVDFEELMARQATYREQEKLARILHE